MNSDSGIRGICEKIFQKYNEEKVKDAFALILKLLNNILSKPGEDKFRIFKKSNEAIKSKILLLKETLDLMKAIGYVDLDEEILAFQGEDLSHVKSAVAILTEYNEIIDKQLQEKQYQQQKKKEEDQIQFQKEIDEKYRQEKLRQHKIKEQLEADKKEREKMEKPQDSVGTSLNYGAKVCKFEPKQGQERG
jgi:hypothetical protein